MNICIVGGAGYVGSSLVPYLIKKAHKVTVLDTFWYGDHLRDHPNLLKIKGDVRTKLDLDCAFSNQDAVIHLACVSNDPSFDLNPTLGREVNLESFPGVLDAIERSNVKRFIFASSSSVYGVSDEPFVDENTKCNPLTDYSRFKLECENMLFRLSCPWVIVRPATIAGYSPRMRLDLVLNALTINAVVNKKIIVHGGEQIRPNINVKDMVRVYESMLFMNTSRIHQQIFNAGADNHTVKHLSQIVQWAIGEGVEVQVEPVIDQRSYKISSEKAKRVFDFYPKFSLQQAAQTIEAAYNYGMLPNALTNPEFYNIKQMKELNLAG